MRIALGDRTAVVAVAHEVVDARVGRRGGVLIVLIPPQHQSAGDIRAVLANEHQILRVAEPRIPDSDFARAFCEVSFGEGRESSRDDSRVLRLNDRIDGGTGVVGRKSCLLGERGARNGQQ